MTPAKLWHCSPTVELYRFDNVRDIISEMREPTLGALQGFLNIPNAMIHWKGLMSPETAYVPCYEEWLKPTHLQDMSMNNVGTIVRSHKIRW